MKCQDDIKMSLYKANDIDLIHKANLLSICRQYQSLLALLGPSSDILSFGRDMSIKSIL